MSLVLYKPNPNSRRGKCGKQKPKKRTPQVLHLGRRRPVLYTMGVRRPTPTVGHKRKGRDTRPYNFRPRSDGIPIVDPVLGFLGRVVFPVGEMEPYDPRRRARNLGHVVDGALGYATDILWRVPLVGGITGRAGRIIARGVRFLEDGLNFCTRPLGVTLFLICLLTLISPGEAVRRYPGNASLGESTRVTNCCGRAEIVYCTQTTCAHAPGCVICSAGKCWLPHSPLTSVSPDYDGTDPVISHNLNFVTTVALTCDLFAMNELCGLAVVGVELFVSNLPLTIPLEDSDCYLMVASGVDPGILSFFKWLATEFSMLTATVDFVSKIPSAFVNIFSSGHWGVVAGFFYFASASQWLKVVSLLVLYVESSVAAPYHSFDDGWTWACSPYLHPPKCPQRVIASEDGGWDHHYCYGPHLLPDPSSSLLNCDSPSGHKCTAVTLHPKAWGCVFMWESNKTVTCCSNRAVPAFCSNCSSDCTWQDPRQRYEVCGTTPYLTTLGHVSNGNCTTYMIGAMVGPPVFVAHRWRSFGMVDLVHAGVKFRVGYNASFGTHAVGFWARLPFTPTLYQHWWAWVPRGFYTDLRDLSTGLLSKDSSSPEYQIFFSAGNALNMANVSTRIIICFALLLLGSRYVLLGYIFFLSFDFLPLADGLEFGIGPPVAIPRAAVAGSFLDGSWLGFLVFLLCFRYGPWIAVFLKPTPVSWLFACLCSLPTVECFSAHLAAMWYCFVCCCGLGLFAWHAPRVSYTAAYLLQVFEAQLNYLFDHRRNVGFFLAVVVFPQVTACCCCCVVGLLVLVWLATHVSILLIPPSKLRAWSIVSWVSETANWALPVVLAYMGDCGHFFYSHLGQKLDSSRLVHTDPYFPLRTQVVASVEVGRAAACGDMIGKLPISARRGDVIYAGIGPVPADAAMLSPFTPCLVHSVPWHRTIYQTVTGLSSSVFSGSIHCFSSPTRSWMGFSMGGCTFTAHHGSRGRRLCTVGGPRLTVSSNPACDIAVYPALEGCVDLIPCTCADKVGYLVTKSGRVYTVSVGDEEKWPMLAALPLGDARGSSGAPVLCRMGHVRGMFVSVFKSTGCVAGIRVKPVSLLTSLPTAPKTKPAALSAPPPIPKDEVAIVPMVAATGSGKSTKLPLHYAQAGHKVLVLNPSVATTLAMGPYMKEAFGFGVNIRAADTTATCGSRLTYSTYGRFLAAGCDLSYDVVICDECHANDGTTVLGIGRVLAGVHSSSCKLVILATATPPGCAPTPHPNVTEVALRDDGELEIAKGKRFPIAPLKSGRHLIFLTSKAACEAMAGDLRVAGINAVAYYRGKPVSEIPADGPCVVVATDALMTGYTGNFDSVIDCCLQVEPVVTLDFDPTFTIDLATKPADTMRRVQRRGRCGRGKPGTYYYALPSPTPSDLVPTASVIEAFDSGLAFFGLTPAEVAEALDAYNTTPGTGSLEGNFRQWCDFFAMLAGVSPYHVTQAKAYADSYVYLTAYAREVLRSNNCRPPDNSPRWTGIRGTCDPVCCYYLDGPGTRFKEVATADTLRSCFDEDLTSMLPNLAIAGFSCAVLYVAADAFGAFTVTRSYSVRGTGDAGSLASVVEEPDLEFEECAAAVWTDVSTYVGDMMSKLQAQFEVTRQAIAAYSAEQGKVVAGTDWGALASTYLPHLMSLAQYVGGLLTLPDNPVIASVMGGTGMFLLPATLGTKAFYALLGGAFASRLSTMRGSAMFVAGSMIGGILSTVTLADTIISLLSGYTAATHAALVAMKALGGTWPSLSDISGLAAALANPGAGLAGAALGVLAHFLTEEGQYVWTNRLLAMLAKSTIPANYFVEEKTMRGKILKLLQTMTPWSLICTLIDWVSSTSEMPCTGPGGMLYDLVAAVGSWVRAVCEYAAGLARKVVALPGVPLASCTKGWKGMWRGTGMVTVTCACGQLSTWSIQGGTAKRLSGSKFCCSYWSNRIPVNATFQGAPRPHPHSWHTMVVSAGCYSYIQYEARDGEVFVTAVSSPDVRIPPGCPKLAKALMVDGIVVNPYAGHCRTPWTGVVTYGRKHVRLPLCVSLPSPSCNAALGGAKRRGLDPIRVSDLSSSDEVDACPPVKPGGGGSPPDSGLGSPAGSLPATAESSRAPTPEAPAQIPPGFTTWAIKARQRKLPAVVGGVKKDGVERPTEWKAIRPPTPPTPEKTEEVGFRLHEPGSTGGIDSDAFETASETSMAPVGFRLFDEPERDDFKDMPPLEGEEGDPDRTQGVLTVISKQGDPCVTQFAVSVVNPAYDRPPSVQSLDLETASEGSVCGQLELANDAFEKSSRSSWETIGLESATEESTSMSYVWTFARIAPSTRGPKIPSAIAAITRGLGRVRTLAYSTSPADAEVRKLKVTQFRSAVRDQVLLSWIERAKSAARSVRASELSYEEAAAMTRTQTAKSCVTGLTGAEVKAGGKKARGFVQRLYDQVASGTIPDEYRTVTIMPKEEVFAITPEKPTHKPPRLIAFPPLEMRTVEKMILGELAPKVVKAVCGPEYGFLYTPFQRVERLLEMWYSKRKPFGFTCDTVCFDSTITPDDVAVETAVYNSAQISTSLRSKVTTISNLLYAGGPMRSQAGENLGVRQCRASGVFTTSSSNTMTCWIKAHAALESAGVVSPSLLVNGDDCVIIAESQGYEQDVLSCGAFTAAMKRYGCPQDSVATPQYSLEELNSCSSNVSVAQSRGGVMHHYLTRDPRIPFARCSMEGSMFNPMGTWVGFIIQHFPSLWVSRVIVPHLLRTLLFTDPLPKNLSFEWWGKSWSVPLNQLPEILQALHGDAAWACEVYTPYEVQRVSTALRDMKMPPLRHWRKRAREIRVACERRGGPLKRLAIYLLWWTHSRPLVPLDKFVVKQYSTLSYNDFYSDPSDFDPLVKVRKVRSLVISSVGLFLLLRIMLGV
nr:MAG: polyprotein [Wufeng rodent hepacivirus 1]